MIHSRLTMRSRAVLGAGMAMLVLAGGCGTLAVWSAPEKTKSATRTPAAERADTLFWRTLHGGAYDQIPQSLTALKAAYLANPNDSVTAAHIGFMHIWRLAERARIASGPGPEITDDAVLARKYFEEAVRLDPGEARYLGFYASLLMTEGTIHKDDKLVRRGYYTMREAVTAWPEFNYFTAGYSASALPYDSPRFKEACRGPVAEPRRVRGRARGPRQPGLRPVHAARDQARPQARLLELLDRAAQLRGLLPELRRHAREGR